MFTVFSFMDELNRVGRGSYGTSDAVLYVLLLIPGPGKGTMTGKIFEYLTMNKKIFAIAPGNEVIPKVLGKTKTGTAVKSNSPVKIASEFKKILNRKKQINPNKNEIKKYNCKYTTEELAKIFNSVYTP